MKRQSLWILKRRANIPYQHKELVKSEFADPDSQHEKQLNRLSAMVNFCKQYTPYYRERFDNTPLTSVDDIQRFPILTKDDLQKHAKALLADRMPRGQKAAELRKSSGTTGQPTQVIHTQISGDVFSAIKQREYRWFDFDPRKTLAAIRLPGQLPPTAEGTLDIGQTLRLSGWPSISRFFHTAEFLGYSVFNSIEKQLDWLQENTPHYLISYAESLEHLAFAYSGSFPKKRLQALLSISETLTSDMRARITQTFSLPINQNYGLNELGVVASRCPEGGRYHVHSEYYHLEIVDQDGQLCAPGEKGRILVTSLSNLAMPLLRYDTDDLAIATDQQCPCGRTLPCFGEVLGRYSRIAYLPEETLGHVGIIRELLVSPPSELAEPLRKFQIYQNHQGGFELRLVGAQPFDPAFFVYFLAGWEAAAPLNAPPFSISQVDQLAPLPGGKFQDFISEFTP